MRHLIAALMAVFALGFSIPAQAANPANIYYTLKDCGISSLSGSSQSLSTANPNRLYLGIFNTGNASVYVNVAGGTAASTGISSVTVGAGNSLVMTAPTGIPRNAITIIGTTAQPVACFEGN